MKYVHTTLLVLSPLAAVFFISAFASALSDSEFRTWTRFAIWWIPLSMFAILVAPTYSRGILDPIEKGTVALAMSALFIAISVGIIAFTRFRTRA